MAEIKAKGYEGKSTILREFVQPYREAPKKQATVRFEEERALLIPWQIKPLYQVRQWELWEVSKDCFISYQQNKYSVPYRYV